MFIVHRFETLKLTCSITSKCLGTYIYLEYSFGIISRVKVSTHMFDAAAWRTGVDR